MINYNNLEYFRITIFKRFLKCWWNMFFTYRSLGAASLLACFHESISRNFEKNLFHFLWSKMYTEITIVYENETIIKGNHRIL